MRSDGRQNLDLRPITITGNFINNQPGSVLYEQGNTKVIGTAVYDAKVPHFLKDGNRGWISAEYAMLPGSTGSQRVNRERQKTNNRNIEIQRFIGRAIRTTIDLREIDGLMIYIDTDIIQADGGTRCASINAGMLSLVKLLRHLVYENIIKNLPKVEWIAAVSLGVKNGEILMDLNYEEDLKIDADINIVSSMNQDIIEVQAFSEHRPISKGLFDEVVHLAIEKNLAIIETLKKQTGGKN